LVSDLVNKAREQGRQLLIRKYATSEGKVSDVYLKLEDSDIYPKLQLQTIAWLDDLVQHGVQSKAWADCLSGGASLSDDSFTPEVQTAAEALSQGLKQKRMVWEAARKAAAAGVMPDSGKTDFTPVAEAPHNLYTKPGAPGTLYLRNILVKMEVVLTPAPEKKSARKAAAFSWESFLRKTWPLASFGAQYALADGKYETIELS
jgi:hypothetical protein